MRRLSAATRIGILYFKTDSHWDYQSMYNIIEFKLNELLKSYYHTDVRYIKATRIASKLAKRLQSDQFYDRWIERHNRKWGHPVHWTAPIDRDGETMYRFSSSRPNAVFEREKAQERSEYLAYLFNEESIKERDNRLLFAILAKHIRGMWD